MDAEAAASFPRYLPGYSSLAAFIASDRDHTASIYKRFNRLAARNLLHLQSELAELQAKQDRIDDEERRGDHATKQYSRNWPAFCDAALHDPRQRERKELAEHIRVVLREYSTSYFSFIHTASYYFKSNVIRRSNDL
jgi:hypothetical protein